VVAVLVRLKLTLLANSLRRSVWRTVGLVVGLVYGLGAVVAVLAGLVALRYTSPALTADVTVVAFSLLTLGWLLMSLLVFGVDETVDPARFALLPVRARQLLPGLLAAALLGVPGIATVLVAAGLVVTWARTGPLTVAAVLAFPLGVVTCVLLARVATSALAAVLASRRFRDLVLVGFALFGVVVGLGANLLGTFGAADPDRLRQALAVIARVAGWSPFGWAWAVPADISRGRWLVAGVHLLLAGGLVVALWWAWGHFLAVRLTSPIESGAEGRKVAASSWVDRLFPATPADGVAGRALRYWRRDPRYLAGLAGFLVGPVILIVVQVTNPNGADVLAVLAPALIGLLVGVSVAQDLSYDGSAIWLHAWSGVPGADDRAGRVRAAMVVFLPLIVIMLLVSVATTGEWRLLAPAAALALGLALASLGVGSVVGTLWQWPAPPPGANPFAGSNKGGLPSLLSFTLATFSTLAVGLPTIALVIWSFFTPWVGVVALVVGLASGIVVLRIGIRLGGRLLDRRWPEVLQAVSERTG
jgi:ABC-2 type transport system permease protein